MGWGGLGWGGEGLGWAGLGRWGMGWGELRWAVVEGWRRESEERSGRAKSGRDGDHSGGRERAEWGRVGQRGAERGRGSTRVATYVSGDEHAVEPHRGVAEGAFKVEPEHVALPLRWDGELLPVPEHVAR